MLTIAICDDERDFREQIRDFLYRYRKSEQIHFRIVETQTGQNRNCGTESYPPKQIKNLMDSESKMSGIVWQDTSISPFTVSSSSV